MTTPTVIELVGNGNRVGRRVELARYSIPAGERVLYGQRINGGVRVTSSFRCETCRAIGSSSRGPPRSRLPPDDHGFAAPLGNAGAELG